MFSHLLSSHTDIKAKNVKGVRDRLVKGKERPNQTFIDPAAANCLYTLIHKVGGCHLPAEKWC